MDHIPEQVMKTMDFNELYDTTTVTELMTDFAGELFDKLWSFTDMNIIGVEGKSCFEKTAILQEISRPDLHQQDYMCLVPKVLTEENLNWCMYIFLL